jgi:hypothetical protein
MTPSSLPPVNPYAPPRPLEQLAPELSPRDGAIHGGGQISWSDYCAGVRLAQGKLGLVRWLGMAMVFVGGTLLVVSADFDWEHPLLFALILVMTIIALQQGRRWLLMRRIHTGPFGIGAPQEIAADHDGVLVRTQYTTTHLQWPQFARYRVNARVTVLFYGSGLYFLVVPRSHFSDAESWHGFLDLVAANVPIG